MSSETLSPEKQKLFDMLLKSRGIAARESEAIPRLETREGRYPLSFSQRRLWFLDQLEPGSPLYNIHDAVSLRGRLDVGALERSFNEVIRRHEALRTTFVAEGGEPWQVVAEELRLSLRPVELAGAGRDGAEVRRLAREEARRPFDLAQGPLLRLLLLRLGEDEHVLLLTMHHIVADGWSLGVLIREVATLYDAFTQGKRAPLRELPVQYADFALWQRRRLEGELLGRQLDYWRAHLASTPALELQTDRPRAARRSHAGGSVDMRLGAELSEALRGLSRREGVTMFMTLLAAFQVLLARYANQQEVVVGTPVAGRTRPELEGLIGCFVNTLALRADLAGDPTCAELLRRTKEVALGAFAYQEVPFEKLVEELQPERDLGRAPLFQAFFTLQNAPRQSLELQGLRLRELEGEAPGAKFDLSLALAEGAESVGGTFEYDRDLFNHATAERMANHYRRVLELLVSEPTQRIGRLSLLTEAERRQVLYEWNETGAAGGALSCVHQLFEAQARRTPDRVAVVAGRAQLTYAELDRRAELLAARLAALGVGAESTVGLLLGRTPEAIVALLAVLKAGGAYLLLDASSPAERLRYMLAEAGVRLLITESSLRASVPEGAGLSLLSLDEEAGLWSGGAPAAGAAVCGESLAYVLYTSGSTGKPKGVGVSHAAVVNFLLAMSRHPGLDADDRLLAVTPWTFDIAGLELYLPLALGARVVLASRETAADGARLRQELAEQRATAMQATPATWRMLLAAGWEGEGRLKVLCGGEALNAELAEDLTRRSEEVWNLYGPTETTIWSARWRVDGRAERVLIGRPIENTEIYVLDGQFEPVPPGVAAEVYIGGEGLARGYVGRAELTAERFVPDPFGRVGGRLYRTGDVGRHVGGGELQCLGRADHQVKVRGFRIEPGEVEAALREQAGVVEAVVTTREARDGETLLVAYFVAEGGAPGVEELRRRLKQKLPEYMVPSLYVRLDALPLNANGKLDRKALPTPEVAPSSRRFVAPRNASEEIVAGVFAEVLKLERVGAEDDFFALGGHSLLAAQVVSRLRGAFGAEVPLRALFEGASVAGLAERIEQTRREGGGLTLPPLTRADRVAPLPLSFAQQRLWFIDQLEPGSSAYNIPAAVRLRGALDVEALRRSFEEIVRRHEALRTGFKTREGEPYQVIGEAGRFELPTFDLSHLSEQEREQRAREWAAGEATKPFDLSEAPLLRVGLAKLCEGEHVLAVTMHHIVSDGWSVGVLIRELSALYEAYSRGEESPLPELGIQYADFAVWQREWLQGEVLDRQLNYWRERLAGIEPLELPTDRPRPAAASHRGQVHPFVLDADLTGGLKALSRSEGVTLFMTLLAALDVLLSRYSGQEDVVVGAPIANRTLPQTESLIGFFVNTLVLRAEVGRTRSFKELLSQVKRTALAAYEHQDVPFEKLVDALMPERDLSRSPLFQVMLILQNAPRECLQLGAAELEGFGVGARPAKFDLSLFMWEEGDGLACELEYAAELFERETAARMLGHLKVLLEGALATPEASPRELPLLCPGEREQLLCEWGTDAQPAAHVPTVVELMRQQARLTPDAVAVVHGVRALSYGELDARSNKVARRLLSLGVGPESVVAVGLRRGVELVAALLGVLKAGAAYVPLDVSYPAERLAYMVRDSGARLVLTDDGWEEVGQETAYAWEEVWAESGAEVECAVVESNLAYVIYTSGSTGRPKGVAVTHGGLSNHMRWFNSRFELSAEDCVYQKTPVSFDASVWEFYAPLTTGGRLLLAADGAHRDAAHLAAEMAREQVTLLQVVPTLLRLLVREPGLGACRGLRTIFCGGEALEAEAGRELRGRLGEVGWVNLYGPTEATIEAGYWAGVAGEVEVGWVPLGVPVANTQLVVCDGRGQLTPAGVYGELYIGGAGLAQGYLNRPELTAERFVPHPYSEEPGARLYRTGDLVRWRGDANLEFAGRLDHQVKLRGYRIELGEIEAALAAQAGVRQAVAVVREDAPGEQRLVAYVLGDGLPDAAELRAALRERLAEYMVPSAIMTLEELPLTPNGKIDRKALPAPPTATGAHEYVAPRTPAEQILADVFAQVLKLERVGIHDNFFALGGDSILSIHIGFKARQAGLQFSTQQLFRHQTIAELAAVVGVEAASDEEQADAAGGFPLTPVQQRFFELEFAEPHHFNQAIFVEVRREVDPDRLRAALGHLFEHHEGLRLRFHREGAQWRQEVAPAGGPAPFEVVDLSDLTDAEASSAIEATLARQQTTLDLAAGPLARVTLFRRGGRRPDGLAIVCHHMAVDGVSWRILLEDLEAAYEQVGRGMPVQLPRTTTPLKRWAQRLSDYARTPAVQAEQDYWLEQLTAGAGALPLDFPGGANTEASTRTVTVSLGEDETDRLLREAQGAFRAQINEILLTALAQAFRRWTGSRSLVVDLEGHGREQVVEQLDLARTVGWFTTIYPVALTLGDRDDPAEELRAVKEQLRRVPNHGVGYGALRYLSAGGAREKLSRPAPPPVLFNYFGQLDLVLSESSLFAAAAEETGPPRSPLGARSHLLAVDGAVVGGRLRFNWSYSSQLHRRETVERLAADFLGALRALVERSRTPSQAAYGPADFPKLRVSQGELDAILAQVDVSPGDEQ